MFRVFLSLLAALLFANASWAQGASEFYVVDRSYVAEHCAIGRMVYARHLQNIEDLRKMSNDITEELKAKERQLTELRDQIGPEEFAPMADEFNDRSEFERDRLERLNAEETTNYEAHSAKLSQLIRNEVHLVALERGDATILDKDYVVYANPAHDITELVIERLDQRYRQSPDQIHEFIFTDQGAARGLTVSPELGTTGLSNLIEEPANE